MRASRIVNPTSGRGRPGRILLVLAGLLLPAGCSRLPADAVKQLNEANRSYLRREYAISERLSTAVIQDHPSTPDTAEALYLRGMTRLRQGQTSAARADIRKACRLTDRSDLIALANAQLGNLEYEAGQYAKAAGYYAKAERHLPDRPPSDRILLRHGNSLQRSGRFRQAKPVLARILPLHYASSRIKADARRKLAWTHDHFAVQCGVFSQSRYANNAARRLRGRGIQATSWRQTINRSTRYVVTAGKYRTYRDAERDLSRIRSAAPDAFIVP